MRPHRIAILLLIFITLCSSQMLGPPYGPTYVGIPDFEFMASAQQTDEWCWAASIQMILNWYGVRVSQQEIVAHTYGLPVNRGASDQQISAALTSWAIGVNGQLYKIDSVTASGPPQASVLVQEMQQKHPILLTFSTGPLSGHAVVITGASYFPTSMPANPVVINSIIFRDPYPSPPNQVNKGKVEISGADLGQFVMQRVRSHWLVSVHPVQPAR